MTCTLRVSLACGIIGLVATVIATVCFTFLGGSDITIDGQAIGTGLAYFAIFGSVQNAVVAAVLGGLLVIFLRLKNGAERVITWLGFGYAIGTFFGWLLVSATFQPYYGFTGWFITLGGPIGMTSSAVFLRYGRSR